MGGSWGVRCGRLLVGSRPASGVFVVEALAKMKRGRVSLIFSFAFFLMVLGLSLVACDQNSDPRLCPALPPAAIKEMPPYSDDQGLPFRFPLEDLTASQRLPSARFRTSGLETPSRREYHAAEDFLSPPGTPVYAIAGGQVSFSGPMGGYGWLVIVDHPQANLYSLYGHLSPSRWQIEEGPVAQGQLLGYLGDDDENGGSAEEPLRPHLHLGIRAGQRADYPGSGEWRWMAGWITPCPSELGWLQPSAVLTAQEIPLGGFVAPAGRLLQKWGIEFLLAAIYLIGGICACIYGFRRDKATIFFIYGALTLVAGIILGRKEFAIAPFLFVMAAVLLVVGVLKLIGRHRTRTGRRSA